MIGDHIDIEIRKLRHRQIKTILTMTDEWGEAHCHRAAKRLWRRLITAHKHQTDNCWKLTEHGQRVKQRLIDRGYTA